MKMRTSHSILVALAAAFCATAGMAAPPPVTDGYDWNMRVNADRTSSAILAYEVDGTDDQPLAFVCEQGGNRIFASIAGNSPDLAAIALETEGETLNLTGTSETTEVDTMPFFTSEEIAGGAPLIHAFAANGWLRLTANGRTRDLAATEAGKENITRFVAFCTG